MSHILYDKTNVLRYLWRIGLIALLLLEPWHSSAYAVFAQTTPDAKIIPDAQVPPEVTSEVTEEAQPLLPPPPSATATIPLETLPHSVSALDARIDDLFNRMNVADRVGQLFVVSVHDDDTSFDIISSDNPLSSTLIELIHSYRIGGVMLSPRNRNFSNSVGVETPTQVASLVNRLQAIAYGVVLQPGQEFDPVPNEPWPPPNQVLLQDKLAISPQQLPLLIAVEQTGDNLQTTALRQGGFTELPSPLAIGSTWVPDLARKVGAITGRELRAVGVNLLLGPSLDVVDVPRTDAVGALGLLSFGGNPQWVSRMGRAYITGVHEGSTGRVATIARHFPGQGDVDRLPDEEVATIQKTLEELETFALKPFVDVLRRPSSLLSDEGSPESSDGVMISHMRFSALQGSSSGRTEPFSLSTDLALALDDERFMAWRSGGGIVMSSSLGAPAIRRYLDPTPEQFPARQIAQEALNSGNDLLFLDRFALTEDWASQLANIRETIGFFQDQYGKDPSFTAQVDAAVRRILRLKLRLYGVQNLPFDALAPSNLPPVPLSQVLVQKAELALLSDETQDQARIIVGDVAHESISLLSPESQILSESLNPPRANEKVLIFTDSRLLLECDGCTAEAAVGPEELARIIDRFYGSVDGTGQMPAEQVSSLTFVDLTELLDATEQSQSDPSTLQTNESVTSTEQLPIEDAIIVESAIGSIETQPLDLDKNARNEQKIAEANWLIFAMLNVDVENHASSEALKRLLGQRSEQLIDKKIVVFALGPPYFLDSTEISKVDAYYGVYSRGREFLENAMRTLFRSYKPKGAPAVAVPGTRFSDLAVRLHPDPNRTMPLRILRNGELLLASGPETGTAQTGGSTAELFVGDTIVVEVGPILDLNGHYVPDNSEVLIAIGDQTNATALPDMPAFTVDGIARREFTLDSPAVLQIVAYANEATTGDPLNLNLRASGPTAIPTEPKAATPASTATLTATTAGRFNSSPAILVSREMPINFLTLVLSLLTIGIVLSVLVLTQIRILPRTTLVNSMCWATISGLSAYIVYGLKWLPGYVLVVDTLNVLGAPIVTFLAMLFPLFWLQLREIAHLPPPKTE